MTQNESIKDSALLELAIRYRQYLFDLKVSLVKNGPNSVRGLSDFDNDVSKINQEISSTSKVILKLTGHTV